ncbi:lysoplasmalogenase [Streptomyces sp. NPDC089424]|uniref:lysoplasmalogenase n=1 Tax=Streptomyces sp. NPDC089424 TaxID=3365917 RepID=UPI00382ECA67
MSTSPARPAAPVPPVAVLAVLAVLGVAAAVDLVSLAVGFEPGHTAAKPLLMPLLALWAHLCGAPRLLVAALLFGWGGDVLLLSDAEPAFLAGMGSFALGHVCYLALFAAHGRPHPVPRARAGLIALGYAVVLTGVVALLLPGLPAGLRVPVAAYSALLTAMAYGARTRLGPVAGCGGALFMLSDTLIATGLADWPQPPAPDFWIMLTYLAAQSLLTWGTLAAGRAPASDGSGGRPGWGARTSTPLDRA